MNEDACTVTYDICVQSYQCRTLPPDQSTYRYYCSSLTCSYHELFNHHRHHGIEQNIDQI